MIGWAEIALRLALASFLGAMIGLERERKDWAAGLRTHMMVCVGASLTMMVSAYGFSDVLGTKNVILDPSRIAAQVISGIGFIGAGTILFLKQGIIRGLTTASGLWTVGAIGLATGGGMYFAAFCATVLAIIILWILQPFERKFSSLFVQKSLKVVVTEQVVSVAVIEKIINAATLEVSQFSVEKGKNDFTVFFRFKNMDKQALLKVISELQAEHTLLEINWNN
jgi:putative Mg2+ transporter-C (MgtC) family protein